MFASASCGVCEKHMYLLEAGLLPPAQFTCHQTEVTFSHITDWPRIKGSEVNGSAPITSILNYLVSFIPIKLVWASKRPPASLLHL